MRWENAGVTNLNHMMDTVTKNFLTFEKIKTLIKSNNFIRYYTLISNIPTDIKKCLKDNIDNINTENFHPKDDFLDRLIYTKSLKFVYITLLQTLTHLPIQQFLKWEEILGIDIADWSIYFRILKKCCRNTYLINFQYKFLHRVIPTNTFLFKIHIKDTKLCSFCNVEDETVEHLFFNCPLIFPFPRAFYDCLKRYFHNIEFHKEQFLLGFKEESLTLNLLILIAKNYIYKCKLKEKIPNIIELKYRIKNYYSLEQYIAIKNNNLKGFEKYWTPVKHVFPDF